MKILFTEYFKNQLKKSKKKYPHAKEDLLEELDSLNLKNELSIGRSVYKIRIKSSDMQKGKSGGFRAYVYFYAKRDLLVPLCIYAKSERESISENELQYHFDQTIEEIANLL